MDIFFGCFGAIKASFAEYQFVCQMKKKENQVQAETSFVRKANEWFQNQDWEQM